MKVGYLPTPTPIATVMWAVGHVTTPIKVGNVAITVAHVPTAIMAIVTATGV